MRTRRPTRSAGSDPWSIQLRTVCWLSLRIPGDLRHGQELVHTAAALATSNARTIASRTGPLGEPCASTTTSTPEPPVAPGFVVRGLGSRGPREPRAALRAGRHPTRAKRCLPATAGHPRAGPGEKELGQLAVALAPAGHGQALAASMLVLDAGARAALAVGGVEALGHHALETLLGGGREQLLGLTDEVPRHSPRRPVEPKLVEELAAYGSRRTARPSRCIPSKIISVDRRHAPAGRRPSLLRSAAKSGLSSPSKRTSSPSRMTRRPAS